jgi:hypothetical protein
MRLLRRNQRLRLILCFHPHARSRQAAGYSFSSRSRSAAGVFYSFLVLLQKIFLKNEIIDMIVKAPLTELPCGRRENPMTMSISMLVVWVSAG